MRLIVTLEAESRADLARQIADLATEWDQDTPQENQEKQQDTKEYTVSDTPRVGTEEEQPDLPLEEQAEAANTPEEAVDSSDNPSDSEPDKDTDTPDESQGADTPDDSSPVDVDTLREQLMKYAEQHGNRQAKALVAEWGKVSAVPEDQRNRIYIEAGGTL